MHRDTHLISPSDEFADTYEDYLADIEHHGEELIPFSLETKAPSFEALVQKLDGYSRGIGLTPGFVPHSTFWLIDAESRLVAVSSLRHKLTPSLKRLGGHIGFGVRPVERGKGYATRMLALTLVEAKKLGIDRALLTCDQHNNASARVIEKNGGVFDYEITSDDGNRTKRYWIHM